MDGDPLEAAWTRARIVGRLFGDGAAEQVGVGRFALRERIGAGGMGAAWAAHDPELEREVALEVRFERGEHARLRREAQVLASLRHEHVVAVHEVGTWNTVQIAPPSVGTYECTISIPTNDTDENPFEIVVQGERVASN